MTRFTALLLCAPLVLVAGAAPYSAADAWALAHLEQAVYCSADNFNAGKLGTQIYEVAANATQMFKDAKTEATVGVGRLASPEGCFAGIKGTDGTIQTLLDADFVLADFGRASCDGCKVHAGFLKSYGSIKANIFTKLEALGCLEKPLYLTGHSLGAAMVHYLVYDAIEAGYTIAHATAMEAPRPGDKAFSAGMQRLIETKAPAADIHRITYSVDLFPHLPPFGLLNYAHALPEIYYELNAEHPDFTDCGMDDSADVGTGTCQNKVPVWGTDTNHHCWFGNLNPCSCQA